MISKSPFPHGQAVFATAVAVLSAAFLAGCSKAPEPPPPPPVVVAATPPPTPKPTPVHTPKPTPTPAPTPEPSAAPKESPTPTPYAKHYAPEGVFFLAQDISIRLPAGLLGVVAGTCVQMVSDGGDTMQVTDGKDTFAVKKSQVTKEIEAAIQLQKRSQDQQDRSERYRNESEEFLRKQQQEYVDFLQAHPLAVPTASPAK